MFVPLLPCVVVHCISIMSPKDLVLLAGVFSSLLALGQAGPVEKRSDVPDGFYVPAYYPAPFGGWIDSWAESYDKAKALVDSMTLAEKTNITGGTGIYMGTSISYSTHTLPY